MGHARAFDGVGLMGNQLVLRRLPKDLGHDVFTKTLCLEDVLVSTVFGAFAYGPPEMFAAWLRRFTTMRPTSPEVRFEFWPGHRVGVLQREPDVFILDAARGKALLVEAKRGRPLKVDDLTRQLVDEGRAARATHKGVVSQLHLLVVDDLESEPLAFDEVRRLRPRLYSGMRHTTWVELCGFLDGWKSRRECDAGHRRLITDALKVMAKYGRGRPTHRAARRG